MIYFDTNDPAGLPYQLQRVIKESGFTQKQILEILKSRYNVDLSQSSFSRSLRLDSVKFQLALRVLAICGVKEIGIR